MNPRCEECKGFLPKKPDDVDEDMGVDLEWDAGERELVREPYHIKIEVRRCRACGHKNETSVKP